MPHTPRYTQQAVIKKTGGAVRVWKRRAGDFFFGLGAAFGQSTQNDAAAEPSDPADRPNRRLEDKPPKKPK